MSADPGFEAHAAEARAHARRLGLADCIHYAPDRNRRADALYAIANRAYEQHGLKWWEGGGNPFLLADGRMVVVGDAAWFVELRQTANAAIESARKHLKGAAEAIDQAGNFATLATGKGERP